jgi:hypothetical protein
MANLDSCIEEKLVLGACTCDSWNCEGGDYHQFQLLGKSQCGATKVAEKAKG